MNGRGRYLSMQIGAPLERFSGAGHAAAHGDRGHVERVSFQCPKALVRSDPVEPGEARAAAEPAEYGTILADISRGRVGGPEYDAAYPERLKATIY